jgi:hypothetical protein
MIERILTAWWHVLTAWWRVFLYPASATFADGLQIGIAVLIAVALLIWLVSFMRKELIAAARR